MMYAQVAGEIHSLAWMPQSIHTAGPASPTRTSFSSRPSELRPMVSSRTWPGYLACRL